MTVSLLSSNVYKNEFMIKRSSDQSHTMIDNNLKNILLEIFPGALYNIIEDYFSHDERCYCERRWSDIKNSIRIKTFVPQTHLFASSIDDEKLWKYFEGELLCPSAATDGNLNCLKWSHKNEKCKWYRDACTNAAESNHFECLKYAYENGCAWHKRVCEFSACNGNLEMLKYAHENGCDWDKDTCAFAAECGNLECLKYAHENGCEWDEETCSDAVRGNHLECLMYAHENGYTTVDVYIPNHREEQLNIHIQRDMYINKT